MREIKRENLYAAVLMVYNYWLLKDWYLDSGISSQGYQRGQYFPGWPLPLENPWLLTRFENRGWLYLPIMAFLIGSVWQCRHRRPGILLALQGLLALVYLHDLRFQSPMITLSLLWGGLLIAAIWQRRSADLVVDLGIAALLGASPLPIVLVAPLLLLSSFGRRGEVTLLCGLAGAYYELFPLYLVALWSYLAWEQKPRPAPVLLTGALCLALWGPWWQPAQAQVTLKVDQQTQTVTVRRGERPDSSGDTLLSRRAFRGFRPEQLGRARTHRLLKANLERLYPGAAVEVLP